MIRKLHDDANLVNIAPIWSSFTEGIKIHFESNSSTKKKMQEKMVKEIMPAFMKYMVKQLEDNGGKYLVIIHQLPKATLFVTPCV